MASQYCQSTSYIERQSPLTGRAIRINGVPDKFYIPEGAYKKARSLAAKKMRDWMEKKGWIPSQVVPLLDAFLPLKSDRQLCLAIDALLIHLIQHQEVRRYKTEGINWLIRLWAEGIIGLPADWPFSTQIRFIPDARCCGKDSWILDLAATGKRISAATTMASQMLLKIAGPTQGLTELGDVTASTVSAYALKKNRANLSGLVTPLLATQRGKYDDLDPEIVDTWGLGKKRRGFDHSYQWVLEKDASLTDWREAISSWLNDRKHGFSQRSTVADRFFAYLVENPHLPRTVEFYCRRGSVLSPTWPEWIAASNIGGNRIQTYSNVMSEFLDWYIGKSLTDEDDFGRPVQSPFHYNPITRVRERAKRSETHRDALPLRYIHDLIRIITEDDFAWPKTLRADYFAWRNPATGEFEKQWSPVRAYAILVKLHLPLRTFQVRMLDSGEADTERFAEGRWIADNGPLARHGKKPVRMGFLRRFRDTRTGREFTGLYINTNKTADIYRDERDKGYEVPWQHNEVIAIAAALRDWQEGYNAITAPTSWETLHDKSVLRTYSLEALRRREPVCFLFRDPCEPHPNEPVRSDRLQTFWAALLDEMERRTAKGGETLPDGSPIKFILKRQSKGGYMRPVYDLHSLRVSLITAYATEGGVPIQILSKCIAGHATILMTIYYNKPGPAYITEKMAEAQARLANQEQQNFLRFLQNEEYRTASPLVLVNDTAGLSALSAGSPVSWIVGDIGLCPVSGLKCAEGGPEVGGVGSKKIYGPVPGGTKNCVRCRFFITGPAFLGGLVTQFNATGLALSETAGMLRQVEKDICEIEDANVSEPESHPQERKLGLLYERRDRLMDDTDQIALNWHATYGLIERSRVALREAGAQVGGNGMSLVLAGTENDLEIALAECTQFELMDAVCQSGKVYPNPQVPMASLRRGRLLDAMLIRNGRAPVFAVLTEKEALAVGNEMVVFLMARCGRADTVDLIEGRRMLDSAGMAKDFEKLLASITWTSVLEGTDQPRMLYGNEPI